MGIRATRLRKRHRTGLESEVAASSRIKNVYKSLRVNVSQHFWCLKSWPAGRSASRWNMVSPYVLETSLIRGCCNEHPLWVRTRTSIWVISTTFPVGPAGSCWSWFSNQILNFMLLSLRISASWNVYEAILFRLWRRRMSQNVCHYWQDILKNLCTNQRERNRCNSIAALCQAIIMDYCLCL